jgi:hypothetical protein
MPAAGRHDPKRGQVQPAAAAGVAEMEWEGRNCCRRDGMRFSPWPVLLGVDVAVFRGLA